MLNLGSYFPITDPTLIFLVVLLIILLAPIVMGKLRIPHIIGMVLAGVVVGKDGFNILVRDDSFELFGRVGLYYSMFLAALEMNMESVKRHPTKLIIFGGLTFSVPLVMTYIIGISVLDYAPAAARLDELDKQSKTKYTVAFLPYKAAMWDSMESIYLACRDIFHHEFQ